MLFTEENRFLYGIRLLIKKALQNREPLSLESPKRDPVLFLAGYKELAVGAANLTGWSVINADGGKAVLPGPGRVIYFSAAPDNIIVRRHLGAGGTAVFVRGEQIIEATGGRSRAIASANNFPKCRGAKTVEDALAAAAGFLALGIWPGEFCFRPGQGDAPDWKPCEKPVLIEAAVTATALIKN